jgi:hypothetical protein
VARARTRARAQALVHFHIGKTGELGISLPQNDELFKIVVSILICSALSSGAVTLIETVMERRKGSSKAD